MSEISLAELASMDDESEIQNDVSLRTGVNVGDVPAMAKKDANIRPNAVRWVFSPFAVIDLTNDPASFSVPFLHNVTFNKIQSIPTRAQHHKSFDWDVVPGPSGEDAEYTRIDRTSYQQAGDIVSRHAEKGVQVLSKMFDATDEEAADLNTLLFGREIPCKADVNNERFPCPVLPNLLEVLQQNATEAIRTARSQGATADADLIKATAEEIREAIGRSIKYCRTVISEAQARLLDEKNPNRKLSAAEERCYMALGEEIPNQMPFLTKTQAAGQGMDSEAIGRGIASGLAASGLLNQTTDVPAHIPPVAPPVGAKAEEALTKVDFTVSESDITTAEKKKK